MSHGPTRVKSFGACIYCGATGVRLTDEHIVPLSLGGAHILEAASCDNCAKITTRFENDVARGLWGDARIAYNAPTRHKKNVQRISFLKIMTVLTYLFKSHAPNTRPQWSFIG